MNKDTGTPEQVDRIIVKMHEAKAWFRRGLSPAEISERSGVPLDEVVALCQVATSQGYLEMIARRERGERLYSLTPAGVARALRGSVAPSPLKQEESR